MSGHPTFIRRYTIGLMVLWTLLLLFLLLYEQYAHKQEILGLARAEARVALAKDVVYRRWNALHGGVYAPITKETPPNPYLAQVAERDITTPSGKKLTLINPAYMTRQTHELAAREAGIRGHITSLKPVRPENAPDPWETGALQAFEQGTVEYSSEETIAGADYLRYMRPLKTEKPCLRCHASQGYAEGDVRGGLSVSVPMKPFRAVYNQHLRNNAASYGAIWLIGLFMMGAGSRQLSVRTDRLIETTDDLKRSKEEWERTFDAISDPIMILDTNYRIIKANKAMADALGVTPARAAGIACYEAVHGTQAPPDYCPHAMLLKDGQAHSQEIHEPRLGGHYLVTVSPLHAPDGALTGSIHAARDISSLKKVEELSRQYSYALERLLAVSREITVTTDLKSLYRVFVSTARNILAVDFSTLMLLSEDKKTLTMHDTIGFPESMIGHFTVVEGQGLTTLVVKSKKPETVADFTQETRFEVPPIVGEKGIRSAVAVPMMMKNDIIGVLIGHTLDRREFSPNDIAMYQQIGNQAAVAIRNAMNTDMLRKSEQYIRDVTASLGEGVYVLNANGETTFMNPEAEKLLGWSEKELIHKNIHDIIHHRRNDGSTLLFEDCEMRKVIETGSRFQSTEELFVKKDGTIFPVSVFSTPLMEDGRIVASVTAFRDISEQKQREQEREKLIADLQKALAEIKTLHGILPICSFCKKIRDDKGAWNNLETYIIEHTDADFSHGLCQDCAKKHYPDYYKPDKP